MVWCFSAAASILNLILRVASYCLNSLSVLQSKLQVYFFCFALFSNILKPLREIQCLQFLNYISSGKDIIFSIKLVVEKKLNQMFQKWNGGLLKYINSLIFDKSVTVHGVICKLRMMFPFYLHCRFFLACFACVLNAVCATEHHSLVQGLWAVKSRERKFILTSCF